MPVIARTRSRIWSRSRVRSSLSDVRQCTSTAGASSPPGVVIAMAAMQLDDGYITQRKLVAQALERELASLGNEKTKISPNGASENATAVVAESIETEPEALAMPEPEPVPDQKLPSVLSSCPVL